MIGDIKGYLAVYSQALDLRAQRQQVLASNIANADTPYYKARDFDFRAAFAEAMGRQAAGGHLPLARTHGWHLSQAAWLEGVNLQYRTEYQSAVDGNTGDMDVERAQIADNVRVGAFTFVGRNVIIGSGTVIQHHASVDGHTVLGENNVIFPYACLGGQTQDLKYVGDQTGLETGGY